MSILFNATDLATGRVWNVYLPNLEQTKQWRDWCEELEEVDDLVARLDKIGFSMPRVDIVPPDVERPAVVAQAIGRSGVLIRRLHHYMGLSEADQFARLEPFYKQRRMVLVRVYTEQLRNDRAPRWYRRTRRRLRNGWTRVTLIYHCARRRVLPWEGADHVD